jgi:hypothetical protein
MTDPIYRISIYYKSREGPIHVDDIPKAIMVMARKEGTHIDLQKICHERKQDGSFTDL